MRAGNLTHRIKFYPKVSVRDAYNASVDSWPTATITTRGELRWVGGSHTLNNDEKFYSKSVELTVRYRPDIVETMRVQIDDEPYIYGISYLEVIGRNEGLRMSLEKLADNLPTETVDPPTSFTATTLSDTSIGLSWVSNADGDGVSIERSTDGVIFTHIHITASGVTSFNDTDLEELTRYYYRVRHLKGSVYSAYAALDDATTEPSPSPTGTLEDYISDMIFWGDTFDFTSNTWIDKSGNNNNIILKNASARTGNGTNLDYTVTGILTTDTVEVVSGSDTPTIPSNGTLRIGATQTVYGVTIKRSGEVWAIIPFCEPKLETNLPTRSFDVSGNGHHAVCATLAEGNITVQHNYFYLLRYGYNLGSENVIGWDVTSWTGTVDDYSAIFSGLSLGDTQSADRYLQPTPDGEGCRITRAAGYNLRLRRYSALTSGKTYRFKIRIENFESNGLLSGLQINNLGINAANNNWIVGNGSFDYVKTATNTTLELGASNSSVGNTFDFYDPELRLFEMVPANIAGTVDALGRTLEYVQDGSTLLKYAADIELPEALVSADQKGCWSDYINQGYCVSGKTYLIEQTQLNHFGVGKEQYDEFVSNGTEWCDDNNVVRELILNSGERGFFFDDDTTSHPRGYTDLKPINTHYYYCNKPKTEEYHVYNPSTPTLYPQYLHNATGYGWKAYKDNNVISDLVIFKDDAYIEDYHKIVINSLFDKYEYLNFALFSIVFDSMEADELDSIVNSYNDRRIKLTRAIVFSDLITKSDNDTMLLNNGHEIIAHTPGIGEELTERKGFHDTSANYTNEELDTYYNAVVDYMTNNNYVPDHKIYPGGAYDLITQESAPKCFKTAWRAMGSDSINQLPLVTPCNLGRYGNDFTNATDVTNAKAVIDSAISKKGWTVFYSHNYSWSEDSYDNMCEILDYIALKIAAGEAIRFAKLDDAYNIIKKIK